MIKQMMNQSQHTFCLHLRRDIVHEPISIISDVLKLPIVVLANHDFELRFERFWMRRLVGDLRIRKELFGLKEHLNVPNTSIISTDKGEHIYREKRFILITSPRQ